MRKTRAFTLIELLIVVAIIAILAAIAVPNFLEAQVRAKVSRAKADLRSLATALESYFIDNNAYPCHSYDAAKTIDANLNLSAGISVIPTFRTLVPADTDRLHHTLTTPVSYLTSYFSDPFALTRGLTVRYSSSAQGWISWSIGPDGDEITGSDLGLDFLPTKDGGTFDFEGDIESAYTPFIAQPSTLLLVGNGTESYTYDTTNGTTSDGDVYRHRQ